MLSQGLSSGWFVWLGGVNLFPALTLGVPPFCIRRGVGEMRRMADFTKFTLGNEPLEHRRAVVMKIVVDERMPFVEIE